MTVATRTWSALSAGALVCAACSNGSGDDAAPETLTEAAPSIASTTVDRTTPASAAEAGLNRTDELLRQEPEVIAPDAESRCERLGYPCSWSDVPTADFDRSYELSVELNDLTFETDDPAAGLEAAVARLDEVEGLAELIVDHEGLTGLMYRLEGMPEMFAFTKYAFAADQPEPLDLEALGVDTEALAEAAETPKITVAPQALRGFAAPKGYHPTGGPIVPKTALVIDPYAGDTVECPEGLPRGSVCRITGDNRIEGSVVHAILDAQPQITSTYLHGDSADPILGPALAGFDMIHVASHGSSGCASTGPGWSVSFSDTPGEARPLPDRCYSVFAIGTYDPDRYAGLPAEERIAPAGLSPSGQWWAATDDYFIGKLKADAIAYMSHCTSADGSFYRSGRYGSYVGWHSYARITTAAEAATTFWDLMATEGLEFDQAIEQLADRGLDNTIVASRQTVGVSRAHLASGGKNQRARDVIKVKVDGADPNGQVVKVNGIPGDTEDETFPKQGQALTFELEGVPRGRHGAVDFEVHLDGRKLDVDPELNLDDHGTKIRQGRDWDTWRLTVPDGAITYQPTTAADFEAGSWFQLEVRAFEDSDEYTAHGGSIRFAADLESTGPLAIFTELERAMAGVAEVEGNDLRITFTTEGGPVAGHMLVTLDAAGGGGFWALDLDGTYDPETGSMEGQFEGTAAGFAAGFFGGESGSGQWQATANLDAQTVTGGLTINGQSQSYEGTIEAVS